jgi:hypothetical protein
MRNLGTVPNIIPLELHVYSSYFNLFIYIINDHVIIGIKPSMRYKILFMIKYYLFLFNYILWSGGITTIGFLMKYLN